MGGWYIYAACDDGHNENHRMYVFEGGKDQDDPLSAEFVFKGKITDAHDKFAIDATVLEHRGGYYFIWSGWEGDVDMGQNLYIAPMENPYTLRGERILLATPIYPWEQQTLALLEGPEILKRNGRIFIIYSASASWTRHYCLGMLSLKNGGDPLNRSHWERADKPVFASSDKNGSFGVGHCCFVKSGGEDWIVYHGMSDGEGWHNRDVRAQRFTWNADDTPDFGEPAAVDA